MKTPLEKAIATTVILLGMTVLAFLPEDEPYNETSAFSYALYFAVMAVLFVMAVRFWIEYAEYKRVDFMYESLERLPSVTGIVFLADDYDEEAPSEEPYDWAKEDDQLQLWGDTPDDEYWADLLADDNKRHPDDNK